MDDKQTRKYNAAVGGLQQLVNQAGTYAGNTPLINKTTELGDKIGEIEGAQNLQQTDTTGNAQAKFTAKQLMAAKAWPIGKVIMEFAKSTGDTVLAAELDFAKSDLLNVKDATSEDRCKLISARGNTNLAAMIAAGYLIDAGMLTDLDTLITNFHGLSGTPEAAKGLTKAATEILEVKFKELSAIEESIFNLLVSYALSDPLFYSSVLDAFEIDDSGNRHRAVRAVIIDDVTGVRLSSAHVKLLELNLEKKSSKKGISDFKQEDVPQGNYTLAVNLSHYNPVQLTNIAVQTNQQTRLEIRLTKV